MKPLEQKMQFSSRIWAGDQWHFSLACKNERRRVVGYEKEIEVSSFTSEPRSVKGTLSWMGSYIWISWWANNMSSTFSLLLIYFQSYWKTYKATHNPVLKSMSEPWLILYFPSPQFDKMSDLRIIYNQQTGHSYPTNQSNQSVSNNQFSLFLN